MALSKFEELNRIINNNIENMIDCFVGDPYLHNKFIKTYNIDPEKVPLLKLDFGIALVM